MNDTICNEDNVSIRITSPSTPTRTVRFRYTAEAPAGVTVTLGFRDNLPPNFIIDDQIVNTTNDAQRVLFIVTPYSRNAGDEIEKCPGESDTAIVWVEPTARVVMTPSNDTICDGDYTSTVSYTHLTLPTTPYV